MKAGKKGSKRAAYPRRSREVAALSNRLLALLTEHGEGMNVHLANQLLRILGVKPARRVAAVLEFSESQLTAEQIEQAIRIMDIRFSSGGIKKALNNG